MTATPPFALRTRTTAEPEPDLASMVVIHRAIRQDLRRLATCLDQIGAQAAPACRARAICRYTAALLTEILARHQDEEDIIWPLVAATAGPAVDLMPLNDDHQAIGAAVGRVSEALACVGAEAGTFAALLAAVRELRDMLDEHIGDKEQQLFPAMRRYLPADAYRWCEQQIRRKAPLRCLRFRLPWLARNAQPDELSQLLAAGGWPARILLTAARPGYARLEHHAFGASQGRPEHPPCA